MNFKKRKEDIINDVFRRVEDTLHYTMRSHVPYGYENRYHNRRPYPEDDAMMRAITLAITEGIKIVVDNVYTDDDFEKDLGLRDKREL